MLYCLSLSMRFSSLAILFQALYFLGTIKGSLKLLALIFGNLIPSDLQENTFVHLI